MRRRDIATPTRFERQERTHSRGCVNDVRKDHGRSDDAIERIVVRIETVRTPKLFPGSGIVAGDAVAASDYDFDCLAIAKQSGRCVSIRRFADGGSWPIDFPLRLARLFVDA